MAKPKRETVTVEIYHKDSPIRYKHFGVVSVHEEGSYTALFYLDGTIIKLNTSHIFRLKITPE